MPIVESQQARRPDTRRVIRGSRRFPDAGRQLTGVASQLQIVELAPLDQLDDVP
jgi:hypothetical protein